MVVFVVVVVAVVVVVVVEVVVVVIVALRPTPPSALIVIVVFLRTGIDKSVFHLPAIKTTNYNLRPMAHGFTLPEKDTCNFIPRMLFEMIYC